MLRRLTFVALLLFVAGLVSAASEGLNASTSADERTYCKGPCYPDPDNDGGRCDSGCFSACCAGNLMIALFAGVRPSVETPRPDELEVSWPEHVNPQEVFSHIFRPPRA